MNLKIVRKLFPTHLEDNVFMFFEKYKTLKKINEKRIQLGKEYIENHFKKIVGNHTIDDDIKNTNKTMAQTIRGAFYSISGNDTYQISAQHSGIVSATGSN